MKIQGRKAKKTSILLVVLFGEPASGDSRGQDYGLE